MPVYRDEERGTWYAYYRYEDSLGNKRQAKKRGFATKREAQEWERQDRQKRENSLCMKFSKFAELYEEDVRHRLKESTWMMKDIIIKKKILPYLGDMELSAINAKTVRAWQKEIMKQKNKAGEELSTSYLATIHAQLSAMFNHAVRFYGLKVNPAYQAGNMGEKGCRSTKFWTQDEYKLFIATMMDKPASFYGFEILYWCGLRVGELLALTPADFDFERRTVTISKSYQRLNGKDVITDPKTEKSNRVVLMPPFLSDEIEDYISRIYGIEDNHRLFENTKRYYEHEIERGAELAGVKRIRVHDLRHSHVSLLIEMGFSALAIAERMGHESIKITYQYAHLFPTKQTQMAEMLDKVNSMEGDLN